MKIIHTRGVYPNGSFKDNGVRAEDLELHIEYNVSWRPGRALFVDGVLVYRGLGVSEAILQQHTGVKKKYDRDTIPYH